MVRNHAQKRLTSANMTASNVEYAIQKRVVKVMVWKKLWYDFIELGFREKKPDCNLVTVISGNKANVLLWRDMEGRHRVINIRASASIAGKSNDAAFDVWVYTFQFKPE
jgi:hypothetical protein